MQQSRLHFVDAYFEKSTSGGSLVFYRVDPLAPADFALRSIGEISIENSSVQAPIRFANIQKLSFWGSSIAGALMSIDPVVSAKRKTTKSEDKFWFLDAIERGRTSRRTDLAAEFAVIKEVFHGMGEYDLEDEAFVRHMRFKSSSAVGRAIYRFLDVMGRFGTSPRRILAGLVWTWSGWVVINALFFVLNPKGFSGTVGNPLFDAIVYTNASLTQSSAAVAPLSFSMHLLWFVQTLVGWFFLGYFFAAFVRKTLR